jgi:hypothetical protein
MYEQMNLKRFVIDCCQNCKVKLGTSEKFCPSCGIPIERNWLPFLCLCGTAMETSTIKEPFCPNCGEKMVERIPSIQCYSCFDEKLTGKHHPHYCSVQEKYVCRHPRVTEQYSGEGAILAEILGIKESDIAKDKKLYCPDCRQYFGYDIFEAKEG